MVYFFLFEILALIVFIISVNLVYRKREQKMEMKSYINTLEEKARYTYSRYLVHVKSAMYDAIEDIKKMKEEGETKKIIIDVRVNYDLCDEMHDKKVTYRIYNTLIALMILPCG